MFPAKQASALVGREAELADLGEALQAAARGEGAVRLVMGDAGMGKTRLADELSTRAAGAGFDVAWGRTWEAGGAPPLWPWSEALRTLGADGALAGADGSEAERFRAFGAARDALRALGARAPVLVVLDDLHAADEATLDLFLYVARGLRGARVALLGTARDAESRRLPTLAARLARIAREGRRLDLAPLSPEEVARLAGAVAPGLSPVLVDRVVRASEGNPLFADELARLLRHRGARGLGGSGADEGGTALPEGVRAVVLSRLALLPAAVRRVLEAASILGRAFDLASLEALGADATGGDVRGALAVAREASGLVAPASAGEERQAFTHVLVREAIYGSIPPARRAALHQAHSLNLEAQPGAPAAERAHHALLGLPAGPVDRAVALAREAAGRASAMGAYADAVALLAGALDALGPSREPALRCDLGIALAEAEARAGLADRSRQTAGSAADLARALSDPARLARAVLALGFTTTLGRVNPLLVLALREALAALGDRDAGLAARLTARLASALQPALDVSEPIALAQRSIELARGAGEPATLLATLYAACSALGDLAAPEVRAPLDAESAELAAVLGDVAVEQRARLRLAIDHVELGRLAEADRTLAAAEALGERLALPAYRWRPLLLRSMRALTAGRFEESDRLVDEAERHARADGGFDAEVTLALHRIGAAMTRGALPEGLDAMVTTLGERVGWGPILRVQEAACVARLGLAARLRALALADGGWAELARAFPSEDLQIGSALGEALAGAGDPVRCKEQLERLSPRAGREVTWGMMGLLDLGPATGVLALLAAAAGQVEEALELFAQAIARCGERGHVTAEASLRAERATLLGWLHREAEAATDRERAGALATALGMAPSRILATREALGLAPSLPRTVPKPSSASAPSAPPGAAAMALVLVREGDVWAVQRGDAVFRVRHTRGLEMLAALLAHPERAYPATELDLAGKGAPASVTEGDAGEVIDARARDAYRRRAAELQRALSDAEADGDPGRAERAREELEALAGELARGVGLGGRLRRAGSRAERCRVNVQRRLKDAIARIAEHDPALGRHLERSVRTGTVCVYSP